MNDLNRKMKMYEDKYKVYLEYGTPKILRVDMRGGKTFTKNLQKPFDKIFSQCMINTMKKLCESIPGAKIGYTQSDEISIVIKDLNKEGKQVAPFANSLTKIISNTASMATVFFNIYWDQAVLEFCSENCIDVNEAKQHPDKYSILAPYFEMHLCAMFDCRYFDVSTIEEISEYLLTRQNNCYVNSVNSIACHNFTNLEGIGTEDRVRMLENAGIKLNQYPTKYFKGELCYKISEGSKNTWKSETAPNFYNNYQFINMIYNQ